MRVLYIGDTASPHFRAWPRHFAARGLEVHVCHAARGPEGSPLEGVTRHPPPRALRIPIRGAWLASAPGLRRVAARVKPDVIHSHQLLPCGYLTELARLHPHVATAWGSEVLLAGRGGDRLVRRVARGAELITADSHHLLAELERRGAPPERLRWVPWGVDSAWREPAARLERGEAAARLGWPADREIVLFHRGVSDLYRPHTFLRAMAQVRRRRPEALGVLIGLEWGGPGPATLAVNEAVEELELGEGVRVVPPLPHEQMSLAFRAAAVCVSIPKSDSAPTSVFEALSLGVPAIVSDLPWVREPVHEEARMSVVSGDDPDALAEAIVESLAHPSPADADANRQLVREHFDRELVFAGVGAEYERLAGSTG